MLHSLASDLLPSQGSSRMAQTESEMQLYLGKFALVLDIDATYIQYYKLEGMWQLYLLLSKMKALKCKTLGGIHIYTPCVVSH